MINENFVILGAIINLLGGASYIKYTLQGKIKPNRISWGLWSVAVMIAFTAQIKQGVGIQSLMTFMTGFVPLLIFISSFFNKKSYWKISKFDILCGMFSLIGILLWYSTKVGNLAILFAICADFAAGIPTLVKSYKYPETENYWEYASSFINAVLTILTFKTWTFVYFGFPFYIFFFDLIAIVFIKFKLGKSRILSGSLN